MKQMKQYKVCIEPYSNRGASATPVQAKLGPYALGLGDIHSMGLGLGDIHSMGLGLGDIHSMGLGLGDPLHGT